MEKECGVVCLVVVVVVVVVVVDRIVVWTAMVREDLTGIVLVMVDWSSSTTLVVSKASSVSASWACCRFASLVVSFAA